MKKYLILIFLLACFLIADSQIIRPNPTTGFQQFGTPVTLTRINGLVYPAVGYAPALYADTAAMNATYLKNVPLAQASTIDGKTWRRNYGCTKWEEFSIGSGSTPTWQQTLTAPSGSTLTQDNTPIVPDGNIFTWQYPTSSDGTYTMEQNRKYGAARLLTFRHYGSYTAGSTTAGLNSMSFRWIQNSGYPAGTDTVINDMGAHNGPDDKHFFLADLKDDYAGPGIPANRYVTIEKSGTPFFAGYNNPANNNAQVLIGFYPAWATSGYEAYRFVVGGRSIFNGRVNLLDSVYATGLTNLSTQDRVLGQYSSDGRIGYLSLGAGLSISSGVLNTSGTVATPISSLTAATVGNTINNGNNSQFWQWNSYTGDGTNGGLVLSSSSTAVVASDPLFNVNVTGALGSGVTSLATKFSNNHTGTSSSNVAGWFESSGGTNNYAIIVPASSGSVGIGTSTPAKIFHTVGTVRHASLGTASIDTTTNKPLGINSSGDVIPMTYWPGGGGGSPAGNYGNLQINRNGSFATPASDSLDFESATGLSVKGNISSTNKIAQAGADGDITSWMNSNSGNLASTINSNPGMLVYNGGAGSLYGYYLGYLSSGYGLASITGNATSFFWVRGGGNQQSDASRAMTLNSSDQLSIGGGAYLGSATTAPTAILHIKAGTATANTAPLKLTTGASLTTAEAGALEYTTPQLFFTNGAAVRQELFQGQQSRVSTQFDKTSNTTLADITGLTATLAAGKTYRFEAILSATSNIAGGVKYAIAGTCTATNIIYEEVTTDGGVLKSSNRASALGTAVTITTTTTNPYTRITGTITVNAAGTLTVQMAQNASNGTASSVLVGSTFVVTEML